MVGFKHSEYLSPRPFKPMRCQPKPNALCFFKSTKEARIIKRGLHLVSSVHPEEFNFPPKSTISNSTNTSLFLNSSIKSTSNSIEYISSPKSSNSYFPLQSQKLLSPVTWQVLTQIFKTAPSPDIITYTMFIKFLGNSGYVAEAFELFAFAKEYHKPDTIAFTVLIRILCDSKMFDQALSLFHEMPSYHCKPDIICYNTLIDKLGESGEEQKVRQLFSKMEVEGTPADVITYSSVLKSLCVANKMDEALSVLRIMEISRTLQPNTYTYNTIVKAYLDRKLVKEALAIFCRMEIRGCKPDLCSFNLIIKYYSDLGRGVDAYMFLKLMERRGIEASESSFRICLYGLMKQCMIDEVLEVIQEIKCRSHVTLCTCSSNNLILWLGKMNKVAEAYSVFLGMRNPDEITMNIVIKLLYKHGRGEKAWEVFRSMNGRNIKPSVVTYNILIHGLSLEGSVSKAFELAGQMEDDICESPDVVTYNCLLSSLCNRQQVEDACRLVLEMLTRGCKPDLISINTLINGMINAGRMDNALRLYEHMREDIAAHSVPLGKLIEEMLMDK